MLPEGVRCFFLGKLYNFPRFQGGSTYNGGCPANSGGGGGGGKCIETYQNWDFPCRRSNAGGPDPLSPSGSTRVWPSLTSSLDPVIDLHILFVYELGRTGRSFLKPHRCHSSVSLSKTHLSFNPGRPVLK